MAGLLRFAWQNLLHLSGTTLTSIGEDSAFPLRWLQDPLKTMAYRPPLGWNVDQTNDYVGFDEGGDERAGFIVHGEYATGALYLAAVEAAMDAAGADPSDLAGIAAWYRADKGLTINSSGVVTAWADQSGNGNDLAYNAGAAPTLVPRAINGRPAIALDSTAYNFAGGAAFFADLFDASGEGTVFAVVKTPAVQSASDRDLWYSTSSNQNRGYYPAGADNWRAETHDGGDTETADKAVTWGSWKILCFQQDGDTTLYAGVDDLDTAALTSEAIDGGSSPAGTLRIGLDAGSDGLGYLSELIFVSASATEEQRRQIVDYLEAKYALSTDTTAGTYTNTYAASYSTTTFKSTLARDTGADSVSLLWNTGSHADVGAGRDLGFDVSADDTGATSYTADYATYQSKCWFKADLGSALQVKLLALIGMQTLSTSGLVYLQGNEVDNWEDPPYNQSFGPANQEDDLLVHWPTSTQTYRWWRIVIDDPYQTTGYQKVGLAYLGSYTELLVNAIVGGLVLGQPSLSATNVGDYGGIFTDLREPPETEQVTVRIGESDLSQLRSLWKNHGSRPLFFARDAETAPTNLLYAGIMELGDFQVVADSLPSLWDGTISLQEQKQ